MCLGLATGYIDKTDVKKPQSLLKPYTMNDMLNDMSVEEKAKEFSELPWCDEYCTEEGFAGALAGDCRVCILNYLNREVAK